MDGFTTVSGDTQSFTSHVAAARSEARITRIAGLVSRTLTNASVALTRLCLLQEHIFKLMKSDSYARFLRSNIYQDLLLARKKVSRTTATPATPLSHVVGSFWGFFLFI